VSLRRIINRRHVALVLFYTGVIHLWCLLARPGSGGAPLFLTGHRVVDEPEADGPGHASDGAAVWTGHAITARELERRLRFLRRWWRAGDPGELACGGARPRSFYLTFDDGYLDNVAVAGPILERLGLKAVIFVIGELLRNPRRPPWWDAWATRRHMRGNGPADLAAHSRRCRAMKQSSRGLTRDVAEPMEGTAAAERLYLSLEEALALPADGPFYIANHTMSHPNLTCLTPLELEEEIDGCMRLISGAGRYLPLLAYPFGSYDGNVTGYLASRGDIQMAFATGRGADDGPYTIRRINLNARPFALFAADCAGLFDVLQRVLRPLRSRRTLATSAARSGARDGGR
jgi:peptidoglycan/xylan/chitin deacetylase (PgdA/CDA1 family)